MAWSNRYDNSIGSRKHFGLISENGQHKVLFGERTWAICKTKEEAEFTFYALDYFAKSKEGADVINRIEKEKHMDRKL